MTESCQVPKVLKYEITGPSPVPRVLNDEMTMPSRVPTVQKADTTSTRRYCYSDDLGYLFINIGDGCFVDEVC